MTFSHLSSTPGEYPLILDGHTGPLEALFTQPNNPKTNRLALIAHPHSLHGGTMHNKVVTTLVRAMTSLGIPSLRFNCRGVGQSAGHFDEGIGESDDLLKIAEEFHQHRPETRFIFAGFSFGSFVSYRAAIRCPHDLLFSIAPPVHHFDYHLARPRPQHWFIIQGTQDDVVPYEQVVAFAEQQTPPIPVTTFQETDHFFHGKLIELKEKIIQLVLDHSSP